MSKMSSPRLRPRPPPDPSVLRPSISVPVSGMKQALLCLENGTSEIRDYLLNECSLVFECKVCQNLFRSLGNFISHKRSYCDSRSKEVLRMRSDEGDDDEATPSYSTVAYIEPEAVDTIVPEPTWDLQDYSPSLALLKEAGFLHEIKSTPLVSKLKPDLQTIVRRLKSKAVKSAHTKPKAILKQPVITLERLSQSKCAMFQTLSYGSKKAIKTMGQKYVEVEKLKQRPTVMVGPDGKVLDPKKPLNIAKVKTSAGTTTTTTSTKDASKENMAFQKKFKCPFCNLFGDRINKVVLHISQDHSKTLKQARRYRPSIEKSLRILKETVCIHCSRKFTTSCARRKHQRNCQSGKYFDISKSVSNIIKNQPVIVLNKLNSSNLRSSLVHTTSQNRGELPPKPSSTPKFDKKIIGFLAGK